MADSVMNGSQSFFVFFQAFHPECRAVQFLSHEEISASVAATISFTGILYAIKGMLATFVMMC